MSNSQNKIETSWKLGKLLKQESANPSNTVLNYNPFFEQGSPFILDIVCMKKTAFILLRNGTVIELKNDDDESFEKVEAIFQSNQIPNQLKIKSKILDICCGTEHILARGRDSRVYSWGKNSYGQLGLGKTVNEAKEPSEITKLKNLTIRQIYASGYNSYMVTDGNKVFGCGRVNLLFNYF